jgi:hypothetical protein
MRLRGMVAAGIAAAIALFIGAGEARAVTWTPVTTGTTEPITAIDYGPAGLRFATSAGNIFVRRPDGSFALEASFPGRQLFDVEFRPSGDIGLASADSGQLYRFSGAAWAPVSLANSSFDTNCGAGPRTVPPATPTGNLLAVSWATDAVVWAISSDAGQVLRSVDAGATWTDASRQPDGSCHVDAHLTDVAAIQGSPNDAWFVTTAAFPVRTADGLATSTDGQQLLPVCNPTLVRLAVDPAGANRLAAVGECASGRWGFSADAGTTARWLGPGDPPLRDVAAAPGVFLAVGDQGSIKESFDGRHLAGAPARGALAKNAWLSVDFGDRAHAAVGGANGALVLTSDADPGPTIVTGGGSDGATARRAGGRVRIRVRGRLRLPQGIARAQACRGTVLLTVKRGRRQLAARNARVRPSCRFSKTITLSRRALGGARRLTVVVRFGGNQQLGVRRKTLHVRVRG